MKKSAYLLILIFIIAFIISCNDKDNVQDGQVYYNPSKPIMVTKFAPDSAEFLNDFVITGSNFGADISKIQVLFNGNKKGIILASNGFTIQGLMPKQAEGNNEIALVLNEKDTVYLSQKVHYTPNERVTVLTGDTKDRKYVDGDLSTARFQTSVSCAFVAENNLLAVETHSQRVRLISEKENTVVTLIQNFCTSKPAVNKARDKAYCVGLFGNSHIVYEFSRERLWNPKKIRATSITLSTDEVWACALDDSEEWLYFVDHAGKLVRMNLQDSQVTELVMSDIFTSSGGQQLRSARPYIVWSTYDKCFFVSSGDNTSLCCIYKIWNDGSNWNKEIYAGSFGIPGRANGYRLNEAQFRKPFGMTIDSEGNLYIADIDNYMYRKIDRSTGEVTTIAGTGQRGVSYGHPTKEAKFWLPHDIAADSEDNFVLADEYEAQWCKLAIE